MKLTPAKAAKRLAYIEKALGQPDMHPEVRADLEAKAQACRALLSQHCRVCHRPLSDPESVAAGIGPDCAAKPAA